MSFFFSCLIALARMSCTVLNRMMKVGILVLFHFLQEIFPTFPHSVWCWLWVCHIWMAFITFEVCFFCAEFVEGFYHEGMLNFIKCIFCVFWNDHMVFVLNLVHVKYHIYWFVYIEPFLHPWDRNPASWYIIFDVLLDLICKYLVEEFCVCVHKGVKEWTKPPGHLGLM